MLSFFLNDPATTEIYTLSLHDALPIYLGGYRRDLHWYLRTLEQALIDALAQLDIPAERRPGYTRSEEHTSELQSLTNLVCRLLLEKKKKKKKRLNQQEKSHEHIISNVT